MESMGVTFRCWAHPRVGGENLGVRVKKELTLGSSPRGRGKPSGCFPCRCLKRLIPAWAGKTRSGGV